MITIDTTTALLLYLGMFLSLSFGAWVIWHIRAKKNKGVPPLYVLTTCEYCTFHYLSETGKKITCCPQCSSYNISR